ncbi:MAG TPA: peptidase A24, partial [Methanoregula sp.]|nr:peptidase A24 [Methanoregula sp.]
MVVSGVAVLATLIYASLLDIRDRRVPFITWLPMLAIGIACTAVLLWQKTENASLLLGYLALVTSFLYADYLDNRGRTDSRGLTGYYAKNRIFWYFIPVIVLPALSWFILAPSANIQILPWYAMFAGIFGYVTWQEYKGWPGPRRIIKKGQAPGGPAMSEVLGRWYFVLIILVFAIVFTMMLVGSGGWGSSAIALLLITLFAGVFYLFGRMHLFGGADAWALIFIAFCVPLFPFTPLLGSSPIGFLAFSVLINALIL